MSESYSPSIGERVATFVINLVFLPFMLAWHGLERLEARGVHWPMRLVGKLGKILGMIGSAVILLLTALWVGRGG